MSLHCIIWSALFILCSACKTGTRINDSARLPQPPWQQIVDSTYTSNKIPGILVGILERGEHTYYTAGFADVENKISFDKNTLFEAGSITKTFTAYVLTSVLDKKGIKANTSILPFLPDSVQQNTLLMPITFLSLMNHTSGLPRLPANIDATVRNVAQPYENYSTKNLYAYLKTARPSSGGTYSYSNLGAGLAGVLAELISGQTYASLLREMFLSLRMKDHTNTLTPARSIGYWNDKPTPFWEMNALKGAGNLQCGAVTLMSYLSAMSTPPAANARAVIDTLTDARTRVNNNMRIGRAWHTVNEKDALFYWHNGGTYGFSTFACFEKDSGNAVVVVINAFNKNNVSDELGLKLMKKLAR